MLAYFKYSGLLVRTVEQALARAGRSMARPDPSDGSRWCCRPASASTRSRRSPTSSTSGGARRPPSATSSASPASSRSSRTWWPGRSPGITSSSPSSRASREPASRRAGGPASCSSAWGSCKKVLIADRLGNLDRPAAGAARRAGRARAPGSALLGYALPDLLRLQRLLRHGHRAGPPVRHRAAPELRQPVQGGDRRSDFWRRWHMTLSPGCATISTSRSAATAARRAAARQPHGDDGARRPLARRQLDVRRLGHVARPLLVLHQATPSLGAPAGGLAAQLTFLLMTLGWVFFRAETFRQAAHWFAALAGLGAGGGAWTSETWPRSPRWSCSASSHAAGSQQPRAPAGAAAGPAPGRAGRRHRDGAGADELQLEVPLLPVLTPCGPSR